LPVHQACRKNESGKPQKKTPVFKELREKKEKGKKGSKEFLSGKRIELPQGKEVRS